MVWRGRLCPSSELGSPECELKTSAAVLEREAESRSDKTGAVSGIVALDERDDVAVFVDGGEIDGGVAMLVELGLYIGGNDLAGGLVHVDELRALVGEIFGDELLDRDGREARIAVVLVHVSVGELFCLNHDVKSIDGVVAVLGHGKVLHDVEHGKRGDTLAVRG